jgi:hypothetical protein
LNDKCGDLSLPLANRNLEAIVARREPVRVIFADVGTIRLTFWAEATDIPDSAFFRP